MVVKGSLYYLRDHLVDAALIRPNDGVCLPSPRPPQPRRLTMDDEGTTVRKDGASSHETVGTIDGVLNEFEVDGETVNDHVLIFGDGEPFATRGDSGAVVTAKAKSEVIGHVRAAIFDKVTKQPTKLAIASQMYFVTGRMGVYL